MSLGMSLNFRKWRLPVYKMGAVIGAKWLNSLIVRYIRVFVAIGISHAVGLCLLPNNRQQCGNLRIRKDDSIKTLPFRFNGPNPGTLQAAARRRLLSLRPPKQLFVSFNFTAKHLRMPAAVINAADVNGENSKRQYLDVRLLIRQRFQCLFR